MLQAMLQVINKQTGLGKAKMRITSKLSVTSVSVNPEQDFTMNQRLFCVKVERTDVLS